MHSLTRRATSWLYCPPKSNTITTSSYKTDIEKIKAMNPKGIILTGGPNSCYEPDSPTYTDELFKLGIPVLGLCYGAQLMSHVLGGKVERADVREYGTGSHRVFLLRFLLLLPDSLRCVQRFQIPVQLLRYNRSGSSSM